MANPRRRVTFENIAIDTASFLSDNSTIVYDVTKAGGSASVGLAVTMSADGTVALCADADAVIGKLIRVQDDNVCTVQFGGGMTLPAGASATVTAGTKIVGALGAASAKGYVRNTAASAAEAAKARGFIVDASTTTALQVIL